MQPQLLGVLRPLEVASATGGFEASLEACNDEFSRLPRQLDGAGTL